MGIIFNNQMQQIAYPTPVAMTPQELFSFKDFGNAISKAADYGKKVVDVATPVVQEAKSQWKQYDPESYAKYKQYWRPASHAINDFKAKDGWGQISAIGGATGIPEAQAAGQIFNAANAGVNAIPLK